MDKIIPIIIVAGIITKLFHDNISDTNIAEDIYLFSGLIGIGITIYGITI